MRIRIPVLLFAILFLTALTAQAQGVIVPDPCDRCPRPPRPIPLLRSCLSNRSRLKQNRFAGRYRTSSKSSQRFGCHPRRDLLLPAAESASISEFAIWDGDRRLVGEVRSREEARRIYDQIVRRQRDPAYWSTPAKICFRQHLPIPPHSDKKLELTYTQVLRAESGTVAYRYPLGVGRQMGQIGTVSGRIELDSKEPLRNVYSPSHQVEVKRSSNRRSVVSFESESGKEPQDFQLFYGLSQDDFGVSLLTSREPGKDGYFLLMISPKEEWSEQEYVAKDIVFVLDTSGPMAEAGKNEKALAALLYGIRILRPRIASM